MRSYATINPLFWNRGSGKRLRGHMEAQVVAFYLMTCPQSSMTGIYVLNLSTLIAETGMTRQAALRGLKKCTEEQFAFYDEGSEVVWVPALSHHQVGLTLDIGKNGRLDTRVFGILRALKPFATHPFVDQYLKRYTKCYNLDHPDIAEEVATLRRQTSQTSLPAAEPNSSNSRNFAKLSPMPDRAQVSEMKQNRRRSTPTPPPPRGGYVPDLDPVPVPDRRSKSEEVDPTQSVREVSGTKPKRKRSPENPSVRQVFEAWKQDTGHHRAKLDQKRTSRIKARLREGFTPEELIQAITHRRNDPFLMGENDTGRVYDGIQTLLRDSEQVERLLALTKPQRERDRTPDDPDWERKRKRVLEATERRIAREEAERRASLARQTDALRRFEESDAPSPAPGPKNAREGEPERLAEVFDIRALAARAGA